MKLNVGVAARTRQFSRALHRLRPSFDNLGQEIEAASLAHPIHEAILIGLIEEPESYFQVVPNEDGFFQVLVGVGADDTISGLDEKSLAARVDRQIRKAVLACPFSDPDRKTFEDVLAAWSGCYL